MADETTWRSVEVEAGSNEIIEGWLDAKDAAALETARFKRAVRALLVENARLRSVLGHCPRGIAVLDEQGNLTGHNRELGELLGTLPALGEPIAQYFAETDGALLRGVVARAGTTRRAAAVLRTGGGDGVGRDIEFLAATLPSSTDRSIGVVLAGEDRTAAIHDETERQSIDDANRLGAWAMGNAARLREVEAFVAEAHDAVEQKELPRVAATLDQLKSVLGRHDGRPSGTLARASVGDIARRAARLSWVGRARRTVAIHVEVDEPINVAFSDRDLSQVLANVVDNAVRAVEETGKFGFVVISASRIEDRRTVEISVKDDGVGIDPHRLKDCFDVVETERKDGGSGVGLAIARALIESVGGTIRALSEPGRGTTVMIELPEA